MVVEISNTRKSHIEARVDIGGTYITLPGADATYTIVGSFEKMNELTPSSEIGSKLAQLVRSRTNLRV